MRVLMPMLTIFSLCAALNGGSHAEPNSDTAFGESTWSIYLAPRYYIGKDDINTTFSVRRTASGLDSEYLAPQVDSRYGSVYVFASYEQSYGLSGLPGKLTLRLDTGEIYQGKRSDIESSSSDAADETIWLTNDGKEVSDAFIDGDVFREVYLRQAMTQDKSVSLAIGKGRSIVGNGLVFDDFAPFAQVKAMHRLSSDYAIESMAQVHLLEGGQDENSTSGYMLTGGLSFSSKTLRGTLYVSGLQDRSGQLGEMSKDLLSTAVVSGSNNSGRSRSMRRRSFDRLVSPDSDGHIVWYGAHLTVTPTNRIRLWGDVVMSVAEADVGLDLSQYFSSLRGGGSNAVRRSRNVDIDFSAKGLAGQTGGSLFLSGDWYLSGFALYIAGTGGLEALSDDVQVDVGESRIKQELTNFMGVVPYLGHTNIFFNGGLDQSFSRREVSLSGVAGRGVAAYGIALEGTILHRVYLNIGLASLWATHASPISESRFYGLELNQSASVELGGGVSAALQFDVLRTGAFFAEKAYNTQTTLQLAYQLGSG